MSLFAEEGKTFAVQFSVLGMAPLGVMLCGSEQSRVSRGISGHRQRA